MDAIGALQDVGWSELEARVYVALLEAEDAWTGYQVAKAARIARANVYPVLDRLVRRGALLQEPDGQSVRYRALPFEAVSRAQLTTMQQKLTAIKAALPSVSRPRTLVTARGDSAVLAQGIALVTAARQRLDVGASLGSVRPFADVLAQARDRGVQERFLCFDRCPPPGCGVCRNPVAVSTGEFNPTGWLVFVRDDEDALITVGAGEQAELVVTDMEPIREALKLLFRAGQRLATQSGDERSFLRNP